MRLATLETADTRLLVRRTGDLVVPVARTPLVLGADPLRDLLVSGVDPRTAPSVGEAMDPQAVRWRAPVVLPEKIVALGRNYLAHAAEAGSEPPPAPLLFAKTANTLVGPYDDIRVVPDTTARLDYEAELAVVIGRAGRGIDERHALDHVLGYTVCNDITARDAQRGDGQWFRGKSFDDFLPMGPEVVTADEVGDVQALRVRCRVNGDVMQDDTTASMIFGVAETISYVSRFMTLRPGDVIATGTPSGVGFARTPPVFLEHGDVVETSVDGIGAMRNVVTMETTMRDAMARGEGGR